MFWSIVILLSHHDSLFEEVLVDGYPIFLGNQHPKNEHMARVIFRLIKYRNHRNSDCRMFCFMATVSQESKHHNRIALIPFIYDLSSLISFGLSEKM